MPRPHRFQSPALQYAYDHLVGRDPAARAAFEESIADAEVSLLVYKLRTRAGLTQAQLARKVGTSASAISRLEDADYQGHSLSMLRRIAAAVGRRVQIRFVPERPRPVAKRGRTGRCAVA